MAGSAAAGRGSGDITFRPGRSGDLDACTRTWKAGIDGYLSRLNQPPMPDDLGPLRRLLAHLRETDPDRFWVATDGSDAGDADRVVGFSAASVREGLWFLAMLFVLPDRQAGGLGAALMDLAQAGRATAAGAPVPGPDDPLDSGIHTWGMCTDAAQPISNGLYARRGIVPRLPIWRLYGEVRRWSALRPLPASLEAIPFEEVAATEPDGDRRLASIVEELDREVVGVARPEDHAFLRRDGRSGFLVRERSAGPAAGPRPAGPIPRRAVGYAYGSGSGRIGPALALDPELLPALVGTAIRETPALGAVALWVPTTADLLTRRLLEAGLRFDGFPGLVCWSRAEHPFHRYAPISLAIV